MDDVLLPYPQGSSLIVWEMPVISIMDEVTTVTWLRALVERLWNDKGTLEH